MKIGLIMMVMVGAMASASCAAVCYVSTGGDDANPGTNERPFKTITKAAAFLVDGGTCVVRQGTYRETAQIKNYKGNTPLRVVAADGERVVFDGREPLVGPWTPHTGKIICSSVTGAVEQVFFDDQMMVEARWPNMKFPDDLWKRSTWATAAKGSTKGQVVDPNLGESKIDWTGAWAILNISHQWWTWTSRVAKYAPGEQRFEYDAGKLGGIYDKYPFDDDYYYLCGKLEALDNPGEWYHDQKAGTLYLYPPADKEQAGLKVSVKRQDYGIVVTNSKNVHISGIRFFGCAFSLMNCDECVIENCHLLYPAFSREITERYAPPDRRSAPCASVQGDRNTIKRCSIGYASGNGVSVKGAHNLVEENLIHDVCWSGSGDYSALKIDGRSGMEGENVARRNTLLRSGNIVLNVSGPGNIVELNHVYDGGLACNDVSLVYTALPLCAETEIRYNWVHGCHAPHIAIGIRGDDKTRKLRVHHNVTWDCGWEGMVVKGDENLVYNNTGFNNGKFDIMMYSGPEPDKDWHKKWPPVSSENKHSVVFNNLGQRMRGHRERNIPPGGTLVSNLETEDVTVLLRDVPKRDFRPKPGSILVDAGTVQNGLPAKFKGKAPDIGAYEAEEAAWVPGITWDPNEVLGYRPTGYQ